MAIGRHLTRGYDHLHVLVGVAVSLAWLAGWAYKDASPRTLWLYFIPAPAMALGGMFWRVLLPWRPPIWSSTLVLGTSALACFQVLAVDCAWHRAHHDSGEGWMRVSHWNTARRYRAAPEVMRTLAKDRPDICLMSEAPRVPELPDMCRDILGLPYVVSQQGMTLCARYPLAPLETVPIGNGRCWSSRLLSPWGDMDIATFDLVSHPTIDRFQPMRELATWVAARQSTLPLLILGDFNTPRDSLSMEPLRAHLQHAHETAGRGWPYTWPMPFPVYAIDHAWTTADIEVRNHIYRTSPLSDHRRQTFQIRLPPARSEPHAKHFLLK